VSPGTPVAEYPPQKKSSKSTHARRRPQGDSLSDTHELCDRKFTCPRRRPRGNTHASLSYPVRSPRTLRKPSSDTLKGRSETLLRHPQRTLGNPPPQGLRGQSQWRTAEGSKTALSRGRGKVLRDTFAASRGQGRGVALVDNPSLLYTNLGP